MDSNDSHDDSCEWYMLRVSAGFEDKVVEMFFVSMDNSGVRHLCADVFVPCEEITRVRRGKKVVVRKKLFPGYIFVKISPVEHMFSMLKSIPRVVGFLGTDGVPRIIPDEEVVSIREKLDSAVSVASGASASYEVGEDVKIIDGPFQSFIGRIDSLNEGRGILRVVISIFGRMTKVELEVNQVEKVGG